MKLGDFLRDVGRPVAYYPSLARVVGGVKEAVFLCQLIYWLGKQQDKDGWIYKEMAEIEEETGLSAKEQRTARRNLSSNKILEERPARLVHRIYYKVNLEALNKLWLESRSGVKQFSETGEATPISQTPNGHFGKLPMVISPSDQTSFRLKEAEITTEITTKKTYVENTGSDAAGSQKSRSKVKEQPEVPAEITAKVYEICKLVVTDCPVGVRKQVKNTAAWLVKKYDGLPVETYCEALDQFALWFTTVHWKGRFPQPQVIPTLWQQCVDYAVADVAKYSQDNRGAA